MPGTAFFHQARNNAWSNHRLLAVCSRLSGDELKAKRTSFFPTILQTLNHILIVDWYYIDTLLAGGRGRDCFVDKNPFSDMAALSDAQSQSDHTLLAFCENVSESDAMRPVELDRGKGVIARETVSAVLSHIFVHQIHHRGQVHAMLCGTSQDPPQLDEYHLDCDAEFRGTDFHDLGWNGV
ncbi:DinB family protein [Thalassospira alkalitolerans]|uniref:DinB family protein n=1 Tax=Thalassospira alkalitolerans TaxID=1293890 RepID=UPI003AA7C0FC